MTDNVAVDAVTLLGWSGTVLPPRVLRGRFVVVVASLNGTTHRTRTENGWAPVTDPFFGPLLDWPEMRHLTPTAAVTITGVLALVRHWRTGAHAVDPFLGLCPTAVILPDSTARDREFETQAGHHPTTVLSFTADGAVDVVRAGRRVPPGDVPGAALIHEMVYQQLLQLGPAEVAS